MYSHLQSVVARVVLSEGRRRHRTSEALAALGVVRFLLWVFGFETTTTTTTFEGREDMRTKKDENKFMVEVGVFYS